MTELEKDIETFKKNIIEKNKEIVFKFLDQNYSLEDVQKFISEVKDSHNNNDIIYDQETENILSIIIEIKRIEKVFNDGVKEKNYDYNEKSDNTIKESVCVIKNLISQLSDTNKEEVKKYINKLMLKMNGYIYQSYVFNEMTNNNMLYILYDDTLKQISQSKPVEHPDYHSSKWLEADDCLHKIFSKIKMFSIKEIDANSLSQIKEQISKLAAIGGYETIVEFANEYVALELLHKFSHRTPIAIEELKELNEYCKKGIVDIEEDDKKRLDDLLNEKEQAQEENIVRGTVSKLKSFFKSVPKQIVEFKEKHVKEKPQNNSEETPKITSGPNRNDLPKVEASNWIKNMYDNKYKYGMGNVRRTVEQAKKSGQNIGVSYNMEWLDYGMEENEKSNKHR